MELYLIRHTTPHIPKNTIYGWSEVESLPNIFLQEAAAIKAKLPSTINAIFSSSSLRCKQLATHLFPNQEIEFTSQLRELNFGNWEMKTWDTVNQQDLQNWMDDFVHEVVPNGESYLQLYERVVGFVSSKEIKVRPFVPEGDNNTIAIICHAGVIRSLLCFFNNTNLKDSFNNYKVPMGCVYKIKIEETVEVALL